MKKIVYLLFMIVITGSLNAQSPLKSGFQIVVRHGGIGGLVGNNAVSVRISILKDSATATEAVYSEEHKVTTNSNGLASLTVGNGSVIKGNFSVIDWGQGGYFIKTETDQTGTGTAYITTEIRPVTSVPYALYAEKSGSSTPGPKGNKGQKGQNGQNGQSAYDLWINQGYAGTKGNYISSLKGPQGPPGSSGGYTHYIGEAYGGGVIFYLWKENNGTEHGLICSLEDLSYTNVDSGQIWSNINNAAVDLSNEMMSSWDGNQNTEDIVNQPGHATSAAKLCQDYIGGGLTDWYLPSIDELKILWQNRFNVNKALEIYSAFGLLDRTSGFYWSSTEFGAGTAYSIGGWYGEIMPSDKSAPLFVRAVRSF